MRVAVAADGAVQVRTGKVELGQGIRTALAQIAADELGVGVEHVQVLSADTAFGPDEGVTSGSLSVQDAGNALRQACAEMRQQPRRDAVVVGVSLPRTDLPAKLAGAPAFIHDLAPTGLLHGRVLRAPWRDMRLLEVNLDAARATPGVLSAHRDGRLLGVVAERSRDADAAIDMLAKSVRWQAVESHGNDEAARAALKQQPATTSVVAERGSRPGSGVARTLSARYSKPWIAHASIAPSCALARWDDAQLHVLTHSQGIFNLRRDLAIAFGIAADAVRVQHADGAGCYGHNGADDVAFDAAWLARQAPGRTVRVLWSRADELTQSPFGSAMAVELAADIDAEGRVLHWRHQVWSPGHSSRPGRNEKPALLGSWQIEQAFDEPPAINMPIATGGGAERNAVPGYELPGWQITRHSIDAVLRASALRSLGAFANVFAAESFVDEIARATGDEPLDWRRRHLAHDARALAVLELAAARGGLATRKRAEGIGHGLAFARYKNSGAWCAVMAEVEAGASLRVRRLTIAVDVGLIVNPDGVTSQIEGGAIQAASWALKESVRFDAEGITTSSWATYPILRFSDVPAVDVHLVASTAPSVGAGEASLGPTAAAIANALFDDRRACARPAADVRAYRRRDGRHCPLNCLEPPCHRP